MTYDNFGKVWSLDHIVPTGLFDFDKPEDLELCFQTITETKAAAFILVY